MAGVCEITGRRSASGRRIIRKGQSKKSGGIGMHVVKQTPRKFRVNVKSIRVMLPSGQVKRMQVCVRAIKSGLIQKPVARNRVKA